MFFDRMNLSTSNNVPTRTFVLDESDRFLSFSAALLGNGSINQVLNTDSVVVTLNRDRRIISSVRTDSYPILRSSFYNRSGNTFKKTFTQEDYNNAEPF